MHRLFEINSTLLVPPGKRQQIHYVSQIGCIPNSIRLAEHTAARFVVHCAYIGNVAVLKPRQNAYRAAELVRTGALSRAALLPWGVMCAHVENLDRRPEFFRAEIWGTDDLRDANWLRTEFAPGDPADAVMALRCDDCGARVVLKRGQVIPPWCLSCVEQLGEEG